MKVAFGMSRKRSKTSSVLTILTLCVAVALWIYDASNQGKLESSFNSGANRPVSTEGRNPTEIATSPGRTGRYDVYQGCTLADNRTNDGDSFHVIFPDGRKEIIRLYFADCPESAFRTYGGGENNHNRIDQQAAAMGRITPEQAVAVGKRAKEFTRSRLSEAPFIVHTEWDSPFSDQRYHAFITLSYNGRSRFLHELLVEKGLARIHTKGAPLPNGTSERKHEEYLQNLQRTARSTKAGAWAF